MPVEIERLKELLAKAIPTPWKEREGYYRSIQGSPSLGQTYGDLVTTYTGTIAAQQGRGKNNVALIVAAVNALPSLITELETLRADKVAAGLAREAMQAEIEGLRAALEPFAKACNISSAADVDDIYDTLASEKITWGDLRRARAALQETRNAR